MADRKRKRMVQQQPDRRANRTILVRTLFLLTLFGVAAFVPLLVRLWQIQIRDYDKYQGMAVEQQTADSTVEANRGTIYDRSGETLAMSATVYNIQLSPKEILACQEAYREKAANAAENGKTLDYPEPTNEFIASNLAQLLDLDEADILNRLTKTSSMYEIIKWRVEDDERDAVISFINENHITGIYTPPTTKRYYPKNSLAAQVIGFVNPNVDNHGAYGIEAQYDDALSGETGRIVTAKNGDGTQMLYRYEDYYDATDGDNLTLTLDSAIQSYCESILKKGIEQFEVQDGGFCIAMDPNTGEILAWANSPTFDLNNPWTVSDPVLNQYLEDIKSGGYTKEEAYQKALAEGASSEEARDKAISAAETEVLYTQWANRSISSTYEPGSTFKSIVLAAALEEGVVTENSHFYCSGVAQVDGWNGPPIKCSVVNGGTGHNAAVEGYRIGGKTGSSQTVYSDDYTIVSFLGFAPADDPQVIILLAYNSPKPAFPGSNTTAGGWYISGGNMAAIMAGELLEDILGHLGVEKTYTANADVLVPNLSGLNLADATSALQKNNLTLRTVGDGGTVTGQIPAAGASIPGGSQVVLYMGEAVPTDQVQVPSVIGLTAEQARQKLADAGLYMRASGAAEYGSGVTAYEQSTAAGASVNRGTTIEVRFTDSTASGAGL